MNNEYVGGRLIFAVEGGRQSSNGKLPKKYIKCEEWIPSNSSTFFLFCEESIRVDAVKCFYNIIICYKVQN